MKSFYLLAVLPFLMTDSCEPTSEQRQRHDQEVLHNEGVSQVGMPAIHNFREMRELKQIFEMRDQSNFATYTYLKNEYPVVVHGVTSLGGALTFLGPSIGYPIPYSTEYTNPLQPTGSGEGTVAIAQADPNGLYSPSNADATWVLLLNPATHAAEPCYIEPKVSTFTFKLPVDP